MRGRDLSVGALSAAYASNTVANAIWTLWNRSRSDLPGAAFVDTVPNRGTVVLLIAGAIVLAMGQVGTWARRCLVAAELACFAQFVVGAAGVYGWMTQRDPGMPARTGLNRLMSVVTIIAGLLVGCAALDWLDPPSGTASMPPDATLPAASAHPTHDTPMEPAPE